MKNFASFLTLFFICTQLFAQSGGDSGTGYEIKIKLDNYTEKKLIMGYAMGEKVYIKDTSSVIENGFFIFKGKEELSPGVYTIVTLPETSSITEFLVNKGEQHFSITTDKNDTKNIKYKGSPDNELFNEYIAYISKMRKESEAIREELKKDSTNKELQKKVDANYEKLSTEVKKYQKSFVAKHKGTFSALIVNAASDIDVPTTIKGKDDKETQDLKWRYYKKHYFDHFDLGDPRLFRCKLLFPHIDYYVNKLTVQHPDSVDNSVDDVMMRLKPNKEAYEYYGVHFLNTFAKSNIVGIDANYVHVVKTYFENNDIEIKDKENLKKIIDNANRLAPLLIGKKAPNIRMQLRDSSFIELHDVKSKYTIILIWRPDCGHCKEAMPKIIEFAEKYKDKGVKVFAICNKFYLKDKNEVPDCWKHIDENKGMNIFMNVVDPYNLSRYQNIYDVTSTPQVYFLDEKKEILTKKIAPKDFDKVMQQIIEIDEQKLKEGNKN